MSGAVGLERRRRPGGWKARLAGAGPAYGALAALVLLVLANVLFTPNFATAATLGNVLLQVSTTVLVAVGMTLVIASGGIDLSVGSVMAVASAVAVMAIDHGAWAAVLAGLAAGAGVGLVNGLLVTVGGIQPFIVTLAVLITGRGAAQVICNGGELIPFSSPAFEAIDRGSVGPVPVPVLLTAGVVVLAVLMVRATRFGRYLVAVGGNEAAARLAGVNVGRTRRLVYVISGLLAGLAGLIETARLGITDPSNVGGNMEFAGIAAAVIGGTPFSGGRAPVLGSVIGALIMAVIATGFTMLLIPFAWAQVFQAAIILLAVSLQRPRLV